MSRCCLGSLPKQGSTKIPHSGSCAFAARALLCNLTRGLARANTHECARRLAWHLSSYFSLLVKERVAFGQGGSTPLFSSSLLAGSIRLHFWH